MNVKVPLNEASCRQILMAIFKQQEKIMSALDDLTAQVESNTTVIGSAVVLIQGFKTQLDAAVEAAKAGDMVPLGALQTQLASSDQALAEAVAANTPADPNA